MSSPVGTLFSPAVGTADTGTQNSRIFSDKPHVDGIAIVGQSGITTSGPNALVATRTSAGIWTLNRTAAGAETYFARTTLREIMRTGEFQQFGGFGQDKQASASFPKGVGVIDAFASFSVGVVPLTSATLRIGRTIYSATVAPVATDIVAATAVGSVAVNANSLVQTLAVPVGSQVYETTDFDLVEVELNFVMANTGTIALSTMGFHLAFNYN